MGYGKSRATSYSDYYKNNQDTPDDEDNRDLGSSTKQPPVDEEVMKAADKRKAALQRRLRMKKAGK